MALIEVNFLSKKLLRTVTFNAIIPLDGFQKKYHSDIKFRTIYLLHGSFGNHTDFILSTRIQRWAEEHNFAVIMPAGENQFYIDKPKYEEYYGSFIAQELVDFTRSLLPLSTEKEDTIIAGISMGGYGALINGLKYDDTFGTVGAISPGLIIDDVLNRTQLFDAIGLDIDLYEYYFDDLETVTGSDKDYYFLIDKLEKEKKSRPNIYISIGEDDFIIEPVQKFKKYLDKNGIGLTYIESEGGHDWDFWDKSIKDFVEWLDKTK